MARKVGGLMAKVANMTAHSRGDHNKRIYDFTQSSAATGGGGAGGEGSGLNVDGFTINSLTVRIGGEMVLIG